MIDALNIEIADLINKENIVNDLMQMIAIPSVNPFDDETRPGFREQEVGEFYCDRMNDIGLNVSTDEVVSGRSNVWGVMKGNGNAPSLMLSGHLDTVGIENYPEALNPQRKDGRIYGRGSCDMKGALAAYLEVARVIKQADVELGGDLIISGLADEEHQMIGSRYLGKHGPWADYGVIGEPTDMRICPAHKGQVAYLFQAHGKAVHSSKPEEGANAINAISRLVNALDEYQQSLFSREPHELCGHGRCCPGVIQGGTIVSTVPDYCQLETDRRTLPGETAVDVLREYEALLDTLAETDPGTKLSIEGPTLEISPLDIPIDSLIVKQLSNSYLSVTDLQPDIRAFPGGTDAPNFGFPTVIFGPGSLDQAHTTSEYVEIEDLVTATKTYLLTVFGLANRD